MKKYEDNIVSIPHVKSAEEPASFPSGTITTIGQEYGRQGINLIPIEMKSVDFDCYSNAALTPVQVVVAESWGIQDIKSGIGKHIRLNAKFSVSNVSGGVQYATTDSNGGICSWSGSAQ